MSTGALSPDISAPASAAGGWQYRPKTWHARARRLKLSRVGLGLSAVLVILLTYFPLLLLLSNSLRSPSSLAHAGPFSLFTQFRVGNYREAASAIDPYLLNTLIVTAVSVAIGVPVAALAAYGFATMEFRGREVLFAAFLGLLLIPWTLTLIPLFAEMRGFRLYGNWGALVLPYATAAQPLLVFLDRAFFEGIPKEILMSARVEGASEIQVLRRIVVPLARPVLLHGRDSHRYLSVGGLHLAAGGLTEPVENDYFSGNAVLCGILRRLGPGRRSTVRRLRSGNCPALATGCRDHATVRIRPDVRDRVDMTKRLRPIALERSVSVILGGAFNSGLLIAPGPGSTYNYAPCPARDHRPGPTTGGHLSRVRRAPTSGSTAIRLGPPRSDHGRSWDQDGG